MKSKLIDCVKAAGISLIELLVFFPALLLIQAFILSAEMGSVVLQIIVLYVLGSAGGTARKLDRRINQLVYALVISSGVSILAQGWNWQGWIGSLSGLFLVLRGIHLTRKSWHRLFRVSAYGYGLLLYFVTVPFIKHSEILHPYLLLCNVFGFLTLALFFYMMNRQQLLYATLSDPSKAASSLSGSVRGINRLWVSAILILISLIGFWGQLKDALWALIKNVIALILRLSPDGKPASDLPPAASAAPNAFPPLKEGHPSLLAVLLEKVLFALMYVGLAAAVLGLIYLAVTRLLPISVRAVRRLLAKLKSYSPRAEATGYVDEEESLIAWKELPDLWRKGLLKRYTRKRGGELKWAQLQSNKDRIRFLYRALIGRAVEGGYRHNSACTPLETEQEILRQQRISGLQVPEPVIAHAYNQARYGETEPSDDELRKVLEALEPVWVKRFK